MQEVLENELISTQNEQDAACENVIGIAESGGAENKNKLRRKEKNDCARGVIWAGEKKKDPLSEGSF